MKALFVLLALLSGSLCALLVNDIECGGCEHPKGSGSFTVLDANGQVLPGWCCGIAARFAAGEPAISIPGTCICVEGDGGYDCKQKEGDDERFGCSMITSLQIRCSGALGAAASVKILGGPVIADQPCVGNFGPTFQVALPGTACGTERLVKVIDCYSDNDGTQFLCTIAVQVKCLKCGTCELTAD